MGKDENTICVINAHYISLAPKLLSLFWLLLIASGSVHVAIFLSKEQQHWVRCLATIATH
jgi:hypothetical protein